MGQHVGAQLGPGLGGEMGNDLYGCLPQSRSRSLRKLSVHYDHRYTSAQWTRHDNYGANSNRCS